MAGIYYKVSLRNQQANQEDNPIAILEDKKYSSSKSDSKDFSKTLDTIKEQATTITDNLDSYDWVGTEGTVCSCAQKCGARRFDNFRHFKG